MEESEGGGESVIRDAKDADTAIVLGHVLDEPFNGVIGVGGFIGSFGVAEIDVGGQVECAFGLEAAAQVLDNENVAVVGEFKPACRHRCGSLVGNSVGSAIHEYRQRSGSIEWGEDNRLEVDTVAHGNHDFFE